MSANPFVQLKTLLAPQAPLWVGKVLFHNADGTSTVELPGGAVLRVRGQGVGVGANAFIQAGEVRGEAPALDSVTVVVF
ncbi:hypothetical protein SAMN02949497_3503 [Methylomagnum ishizawai]|uniref:Uncharacterized protein n=1 Tax=Methylomagnum ishizawai TaxID=1760988 RepID=A0A1Y6CZK3_9GAMM|nr:hypothetical protein [Methylomagnum ishizawai]SMF96119.1 hypothetical protein SAMN02949497_3503 [Methylomagnum ishizawai]